MAKISSVINTLSYFSLLTWIRGYLQGALSDAYEADLDYVVRSMDAVMCKPKMNYESGTPETQAQKFKDFCDRHKEYAGGGYSCKKDCPFKDVGDPLECSFHWGQMSSGSDE